MVINLDGKRALVTGSSSGIGLAIAKALNQAGCKVAINGRNRDKLIEAAKKLKNPIIIQGDVSREDEAKKIIKEAISFFGGLDILICSVGGGGSVMPGCEYLDEWKRVFDLNLWSATNVIEASMSALEESKGAIVCISSICGIEVVSSAPLTYSSAKAALNAYVRGISRPLGKKGIRINAIAPGNILHEGSVWAQRMVNEKGEIESMLEKNVSLSRLGEPQDVASLAVYLVSKHANFATGCIWNIDGGQIH